MKYTLITGASRGIGRACAVCLAAEGHNLILTAKKDENGLKETIHMIRCLSEAPEISIGYYLCDASSPDDVKKLFCELKAGGIRINNLINNAGTAYFGLLQEMTDAEWQNVISTNLGSVFLMSKAVIPDMLHEHSGAIINISSIWGIKGSALEVAYSASKGGVNAFTLALAEELRPSGIRVNAVACEFVDTDMNSHLSEEEKKLAAASMPSGRIISPDEIARLVARVLSADNRQTGEILTVK